MSSKSAMMHWVEQLQSRGRYTFTRAEAESDTGRTFIAAQTALRRLKQQGRVASPRRGFYVVVPPEYRVAGSLPASWFIDDLMRHLGQPYYVGLLSAAAIHGAGHLSNAATVLAELAERLDARKLVAVAQLVRLPDVQRLGFLLDAVGKSELAGPLFEWLATKQPRAVLLQPGLAADGKADPRWHVLPNIELEVDV